MKSVATKGNTTEEHNMDITKRPQFRTGIEGERICSVSIDESREVDYQIIPIDGWLTEDGVDIPFSVSRQLYQGRVGRDLTFYESSEYQERTVDIVLRPGEAEPTQGDLLAFIDRYTSMQHETVSRLVWKSELQAGPLYAEREFATA